MKKIFKIFAVIFACCAIFSCSEETVSGVAPYHCEYECLEMSTVGSDPTLAELRQSVLNDIANLKKKHNHVWDYEFEGSSTDEALKSQDKIALSYYDNAVSDLNAVKAQFDKLVTDFPDWGKGSFTYKYRYTIYRLDKTLAESDVVTFSYRHSN